MTEIIGNHFIHFTQCKRSIRKKLSIGVKKNDFYKCKFKKSYLAKQLDSCEICKIRKKNKKTFNLGCKAHLGEALSETHIKEVCPHFEDAAVLQLIIRMSLELWSLK